MELEKQVVSLELAKKLKKLGVKQESYFYYKIGKASGTVNLVPIHETTGDFSHFDFYSAFTVAELGNLLPKQMLVKNEVTVFQSLSAGNWIVYYGSKNGTAELLGDDQISTFADTEADARAKMLIYLIEHNLITL